MSSRNRFFITIGLIAIAISLFALFKRTQEPTQTFPATINRDCAPWDGAAFTVQIPLASGDVLDISIWKSPDIKFQTTFSFPDDTRQIGNASLIHSVGLPESLMGKVWFQSVDEGKVVAGRFNLKSERGGVYAGQFEAQWGNQVVMCG